MGNKNGEGRGGEKGGGEEGGRGYIGVRGKRVGRDGIKR